MLFCWASLFVVVVVLFFSFCCSFFSVDSARLIRFICCPGGMTLNCRTNVTRVALCSCCVCSLFSCTPLAPDLFFLRIFHILSFGCVSLHVFVTLLICSNFRRMQARIVFLLCFSILVLGLGRCVSAETFGELVDREQAEREAELKKNPRLTSAREVAWNEIWSLITGNSASSKLCGNYCGPGYCGGEYLPGDGICDFNVPPSSAIDSCCQAHDACCGDGQHINTHCDGALVACAKQCDSKSDSSCSPFTITGMIKTFPFLDKHNWCCGGTCVHTNPASSCGCSASCPAEQENVYYSSLLQSITCPGGTKPLIYVEVESPEKSIFDIYLEDAQGSALSLTHEVPLEATTCVNSWLYPQVDASRSNTVNVNIRCVNKLWSCNYRFYVKHTCQ